MGDLSEHFSRREFQCGCKCGFDTVDIELIPLLEDIRTINGPFTPNSACRCFTYNEMIQHKYTKNYKSGTSRSKHLIGRAVDVPCSDPDKVYDYLDKKYPDKYGIGKYSWGVHVDTRSKKARWSR